MAPQKENCAGDGDTLRCSFCGLQQDHVRQLIHGPDHLYICDVCTVTAFETICRKDYRTAWLAHLTSAQACAWLPACSRRSRARRRRSSLTGNLGRYREAQAGRYQSRLPSRRPRGRRRLRRGSRQRMPYVASRRVGESDQSRKIVRRQNLIHKFPDMMQILI